ncbi:MAG: hypothetical protein ABIM30_00485 [candidate division WOR-3 bacterium]
MTEVFCVNCGNVVVVYSVKHRDFYYQNLHCPECQGLALDSTNKNVKIDPGIVYKRWLQRLSILSHFDNLSGGLYHPLTGEFIENINEYLVQHGFKL